jgi:molybdate transport system permease protein
VELGPLALSFEVALVATTIATVTGVVIGAVLASRRFVGRDLLDVIATAPMVLPPTVLGYYLLVAVGRRSMIGHAFEALTGSSIVFTRTGAVLAATVGAIPIVVKSSRAALEEVDIRLVHAARTLGAGPLRAFFTVQAPLAARGIIAASMLAFARSLGDFGVTLMVAGDIPGETQTASLAIYDAIQGRRDDDALAMVLVLTALAMTVLYSVNKLTQKRHAH